MKEPGKLRAARLHMGWTVYMAAKVAGVQHYSVGNAEKLEEAGRPLSHVTIATALRLIEAYYPLLDLRDFVPETGLKIRRG